MKRIVAILLLSLASSAYALPNCPSDQSVRWHNCFGTYTWANGDKYVGEFKDDKMHGLGTYTWGRGPAEGDLYIGEYKDNQRHGQGTYTHASGEKYVGEYKNGKKNGYGTNSFPDGDKYAGEWKDGKNHGYGTYTFANGRKDSGYYMNNEFVPEICEDMGLSKGTSGFEQCVLKLIDKL